MDVFLFIKIVVGLCTLATVIITVVALFTKGTPLITKVSAMLLSLFTIALFWLVSIAL